MLWFGLHSQQTKLSVLKLIDLAHVFGFQFTLIAGNEQNTEEYKDYLTL